MSDDNLKEGGKHGDGMWDAHRKRQLEQLGVDLEEIND